MGDSFKIGGSEFGIGDAPSVDFAVDADGELVVSFEVRGTPERLSALQQEGEWAWALYPPHFYLRQVPLPGDFRENPSRLAMAETDDYEVAMYLMAHNPVRDLAISSLSESQVELTGIAEIMGRDNRFSISWRRAR